MRVLYLHQHFTTPKGATGIRSYQMAQALIAAGHEVTMVCGSNAAGKTGLTAEFKNGSRRGSVDRIDVIEIDLAYSNHDGFFRRSMTFMRFMLRTLKVIRSEHHDILFATTTPLTVGVAGIYGRWIKRSPFVFEVRDLWPELPAAMGVIRNPVILFILNVLEWASYHSAHRIIGLSPGIVRGIVRRGIRPQRVAFVPNGCDLDIFCPEGPEWVPPGVNDGDLVALFSGTHGIANGLHSVLDVATELQRRGRNEIKMILIGEGKLKAELHMRATRERLDNVIFLDPVPKSQLASLMRRADVGLQILANVPAFYFGTSPNKFFDYIAAGLPVLNNYPGWLAETISQHACGYAVPPAAPSAFADALCHAADDRGALREMGRRAHELAERQFDRKSLAGDWVRWVTGTLDCV